VKPEKPVILEYPSKIEIRMSALVFQTHKYDKRNNVNQGQFVVPANFGLLRRSEKWQFHLQQLHAVQLFPV
jgi:hypothetical protein